MTYTLEINHEQCVCIQIHSDQAQRQPSRVTPTLDPRTTYILMKKLFSPSFGSTHALFKIGSAQEMRIRSGVAGLCKCSTSVSPNSFLAAFSASRMAKKTALPMKSGGSPG